MGFWGNLVSYCLIDFHAFCTQNAPTNAPTELQKCLDYCWRYYIHIKKAEPKWYGLFAIHQILKILHAHLFRVQCVYPIHVCDPFQFHPKPINFLK